MCIRNNLLRAVYFSILRDFSFETVLNFWRKIVETNRSNMSLVKEIQECICKDNLLISQQLFFTIFKEIEIFLLDVGIDLNKYAEHVITSQPLGCVVSADQLLRIVEPFLFARKNYDESHILLYRIVKRIIQFEFPGSKVKLYYTIQNEIQRHLTLLIAFNSSLDKRNCFDIDLWYSAILKYIPLILGLNPVENVKIRADTRSVENILISPETQITISDGRVFINSDFYGSTSTFNDIFKINEGDLCSMGIKPSHKVITIDNEYICPFRKRPILKTGVTYGTPLLIFDIWFNSLKKSPRLLLSKITRNVAGKIIKSDEIIDKHQNIMRVIGGSIKLRYDRYNGQILIGNKVLTRGVSARILKKIILVYLNTGRMSFGYEELRNDPHLLLHPKKPNLDLRLKRIQEKLFKNCPYMVLEHKESGRFQLRIDAELIYDEL